MPRTMGAVWSSERPYRFVIIPKVNFIRIDRFTFTFLSSRGLLVL